jgi:hypothetical protein
VRDFEQLLALGGQTLYIDRLKYVIRGFDFDHVNPSVAKIRLLRVAAKIRGNSRDFGTLKELWPFLKPDLRRIFDEAPTLDRTTLAIAAQITCAKALKSYVCGGGHGYYMQVQPEISHVKTCSNAYVEMGYWLRSYWRDVTVSSLDDLYCRFDCLPMFDIHNAPASGVLNFRYAHWPR